MPLKSIKSLSYGILIVVVVYHSWYGHDTPSGLESYSPAACPTIARKCVYIYIYYQVYTYMLSYK